MIYKKKYLSVSAIQYSKDLSPKEKDNYKIFEIMRGRSAVKTTYGTVHILFPGEWVVNDNGYVTVLSQKEFDSNYENMSNL